MDQPTRPGRVSRASWLLLGALALVPASARAACYNDVAGGGKTCETLNQATRSAAVTPSDSVDLPGGVTIGLFNGAASACAIAMILQADSAAVTWSNVPAGATLPVRAKRVNATGTTCTGMVALYGSSQ